MPASAPMKTSDGRFGYEAAGDPASPPLVFLHGIGGAARAWRGQLECLRRSLSHHRLGHAGLWRLGAACRPSALRRSRTPCRISCSRSARPSPILVGHSIGGMIVQQLLAKNPDVAARRRARADQPGVRQARWRLAEGIHRRAARPARSRRNHGFAGADAGEGIGRRRSRCRRHGACPRLHGRRARGELSRHACWRCWDSTSAARSRISRCRRWCCRAPRTRMRRRR